jgi:hypothetical protein
MRDAAGGEDLSMGVLRGLVRAIGGLLMGVAGLLKGLLQGLGNLVRRLV